MKKLTIELCDFYNGKTYNEIRYANSVEDLNLDNNKWWIFGEDGNYLFEDFVFTEDCKILITAAPQIHLE